MDFFGNSKLSSFFDFLDFCLAWEQNPGMIGMIKSGARR